MGVLWASLLVLGVGVEVERLPRFEGRGDLRLVRTMAPERRVFGQAVSVFVKPDDATALAELEACGVEATLGRWSAATLPTGTVLELLAADGRLEVTSGRVHRPFLERSMVEIGLASAAGRDVLERAGRGASVIVGVIDTGIDLFHPDFDDSDGHSRVVAVWDQDGVGVGPPPFGYGRACNAIAIRAGMCDITDPVGHGTHVTAIAAGRHGVAPEADIAVVRSDDFTRLADAVHFLTRLAASRGQALVVNLSVGAQYGGHAGATPLERVLDELGGEGVLLVAAAGNDGGGRSHLGVELGAVTSRAVLERMPLGAGVEPAVEFWSLRGAAVELSVELWASGSSLGACELRFVQGEIATCRIPASDTAWIEISYGVDAPEPTGLVRRELVFAGTALPSGTDIVLAFSGQGRLDGWLSLDDPRFGVPRFGAVRGAGWIGGDGERTVAVPATGSSVIAVAAYTSRTTWVDEAGVARELGDAPPVGALAAFSSRGPSLAPSRTGVKPDVAAPGSVVVAARASSVGSGPEVVDAFSWAQQGTSMSAPHVTGALALALAVNPDLTPAAARQLIASTSRSDVPDATLPDSRWGHGRLDVAALVERAEADAPAGCRAFGVSPLLTLLSVVGLLRRRRAGR